MEQCRSNQIHQTTPSYRVLSDSQISELHFAGLEILDRTGVDVHHPEALALLKTAGARIDGNRVRIPEMLVKQALSTAPSRAVLANRSGERTMLLEGYNNYYGPGSGCPRTIDAFTGVLKEPERKDVANIAKLVDYLPNMDFCMDMGLVRHQFAEIGYLHSFYELLSNTSKPIVSSCGNEQNCRDHITMAEIVVGGEEALRRTPILAIYSETTAPLRHAEDALGKLLVCAEKFVPIIHTVGIMCGATAPITLAGALAQANAELLSGLVIHQLKQPGAPFFYGGTMTVLDMKTGHHPHAAPEFHLMLSALTEMGHHYGLPIWSAAGCTDAKVFDEQSAGEATFSILTSALAGSNLIHDIGFLEGAMISSPHLIVYCDEIISLVKHIVRGIRFDPEELALDLIHKVGPGGNFMSEAHTFKHFRRVFAPRLLTRENRSVWENQGSKTCAQKVTDETRRILTEHEPETLPEKTKLELDAFIEDCIS